MLLGALVLLLIFIFVEKPCALATDFFFGFEIEPMTKGGGGGLGIMAAIRKNTYLK